MDLKDFIAGSYKRGYEFNYFLPEKINHTFVWTNEIINELLEKASLKLGELNSFSKFTFYSNQWRYNMPKQKLSDSIRIALFGALHFDPNLLIINWISYGGWSDTKINLLVHTQHNKYQLFHLQHS